MAAGAILAGWLADRLAGDPARWHPVAGFGRMASDAGLELRLWRPSRGAGALYAGASLVGAVAALVAALERALSRIPGRRSSAFGVVIWSDARRTLARAGRGRELAAGRRGGRHRARTRARADAGRARDLRAGRAPQLCRAAVESVAENTSDAVVAPLLWAALLGAPGAAAYRAVNTLDAMIGHRSDRYLDFGWAAARLDDLANWPAARATALLATAWAPAHGGRAR